MYLATHEDRHRAHFNWEPDLPPVVDNKEVAERVKSKKLEASCYDHKKLIRAAGAIHVSSVPFSA